MKSNRSLRSLTRKISIPAALMFALLPMAGCGTGSPHSGRVPFSWMERAPRGDGERMALVLRHHAETGNPSAAEVASIKAGDVIAFHMSHREAWSHLRRGAVQKVPYELFRYGHLALVVPPADEGGGRLRLLQIAMMQAANASETLSYLDGKSFHVYRPPAGRVDERKLAEFTARVVETAGDPDKAYDYLGVFGIRNAPCEPASMAEIGPKYSCATLVSAGLHYSGYPLEVLHRGGWFDLVTPRQVIESAAGH